MSSTNKTEHYSLPQFIGSDIPTWLGDFNSAMTAIDSGINAAATTASGAATTAAQAVIDAAAAQKSANDALNRCPFPVGFGGFFQTDPSTIYSGTTWAQKKDVFILAAGDTYPAGSTGGEAQHILTANEMPEHSHFSDSFESGSPSATKDTGTYITWVNHGTVETNRPGAGNVIDDGPVRTSPAGHSEPHNNMPPYFAMPFWIRTA